MAKAKTFTIPEKKVKVIEDALRIYLAMATQEYHENPSVERAMRMDIIRETLDLFI
jgi:hypothetical protein